jgi:hypothetical protein
MSEMGPKLKTSMRAYVFRFAPESGRRETWSACPFRARTGLTHRSKRLDGDLTMMRDYEPQSDAATRRMLASAADMAAALSFGCVFVGTIVSALLSRPS